MKYSILIEINYLDNSYHHSSYEEALEEIEILKIRSLEGI